MNDKGWNQMWFQDINRIYRIHIWMQAKWLKCHFNDDGEGCVRTSRRVGSSCISVGWEGWNGYALHINFAKHTITSFTRRVHTNRLELWSFSQGVQASLVRQQPWRGGNSNESNSHADICKTHGQWIHCFKQTITSIISPDWAVARSESSTFQSCKMFCTWPEVQKITTEHCLQALRVKELLEREKHLLSRSVL